MEHFELDKIKANHHAKQTGLPLPIAAMDLHTHNIKNPIYWPDVDYISSDDEVYGTPQIVQYGGIIAEFAKAKSAEVIFPENSAFLHGLGVISGAMAYKFRYQYYSEQKAVNLYCVASQPPSTGKSSIFSFFSNPFSQVFADINKDNAKKRSRLIDEMKELKEAAKAGQNVAIEIEQTAAALQEVQHISWYKDDATAESVEVTASKQNGYVNILSPESDAINVVLGKVYGDGKGKSNHGVFLKMWDTEWHSSSRVNREGYEGELYGSVAVLAQDESIDSILRIGQESGRGISERFLLIREQNLFGQRKSQKRVRVDKAITDNFTTMARNIVTAQKTVLTFSKKSFSMVNDLTDELDDKMSDGGEFSTNMIRGAAGKADKQVYKLASIMHVAEDWCDGGRRRTVVDDKHVKNAIAIFRELLKTYLSAADGMQISGESTETAFVGEKIQDLARARQIKFTIDFLRDKVRNRGSLKGVSGLTNKLKDVYIPELQKRGYIAEYGGWIYVNPKL